MTLAAEAARPSARVAFDVFHPRPWGWKVALYLWTKGIGAGAFGLIFITAALGLAPVDQATRLVAAFISLAGVGLRPSCWWPTSSDRNGS